MPVIDIFAPCMALNGAGIVGAPDILPQANDVIHEGVCITKRKQRIPGIGCCNGLKIIIYKVLCCK